MMPDLMRPFGQTTSGSNRESLAAFDDDPSEGEDRVDATDLVFDLEEEPQEAAEMPDLNTSLKALKHQTSVELKLDFPEPPNIEITP